MLQASKNVHQSILCHVEDHSVFCDHHHHHGVHQFSNYMIYMIVQVRPLKLSLSLRKWKQLFYKQLLYSKVPQQRLFNNLPPSTLGYMASKSKGHFGRALNHYWFDFVPLLQHHFGSKCPVLISNCTIEG